MAIYEVQVDILTSGSLIIESSSVSRAISKARKMLKKVNAPDFMSFTCITREIIDANKIDYRKDLK